MVSKKVKIGIFEFFNSETEEWEDFEGEIHPSQGELNIDTGRRVPQYLHQVAPDNFMAWIVPKGFETMGWKQIRVRERD